MGSDESPDFPSSVVYAWVSMANHAYFEASVNIYRASSALGKPEWAAR